MPEKNQRTHPQVSSSEWESSVIAQASSGGYDPSGWIAWVHDGRAYLSTYGHCSCYGTFTALCGGGISDYLEIGEPGFVWSGTPNQMVKLAKKKADPHRPDREADKEDYCYQYLMDVFDTILAWDKNGRKKVDR